MSDTASLAAWLRAQLDDDERAARATLWEGSGNTLEWTLPFSATVQVGTEVFGTEDATVAAHIALHDPDRVLRGIEAKREVIDKLLTEPHQTCDDPWYGCPAADKHALERFGSRKCDCGRDERATRYLQLLAAEYVDRPGYRAEWKP